MTTSVLALLASVPVIVTVNGVSSLASFLFPLVERSLASREFALWFAHAAFRSATIVGLATTAGLPAGFLAGLFFAEAAPRSRVARMLKYASDSMIGTPSVVIGVAMLLIVTSSDISSTWHVGSLATALLVMPVVANSTCRALSSTAPALREAALALGSKPWRTLLRVSLRVASPGIVSGALLGVARIAFDITPMLLVGRSNAANLSPSLHTLAFEPLSHMVGLSHESIVETQHKNASLPWAAVFMLTVAALAIVLVRRRFDRFHGEGGPV